MKRSAWMAAAVLALASGALAQNQPAAPAIDPAMREQRRQEEEAAAKLLSVNFGGGTIGQYVEALRKASPGGTANIVVSDRSSKMQISSVNLKGVEIGVAVSAIPAAYSGTRGVWHIEPVYPKGQPVRNINSTTITYSVDFETLADYEIGDVMVESYSLGRLLNPNNSGKADSDPKVVLTAIETGLTLLNGGADRRPELKFHPDSALLFVRGTKAEVQLVGSVIGRMNEEAMRRQAITQRRASAEQIRALRVKEARLRIQMKEMELAAIQNEFQRTKQQVDAGAASTTELGRMELELGRARMNVEMVKLELEKAELVSPDEMPEPPASDAAAREPVAVPPASTPAKNPGGNAPSTKRPK